MDSINGFFPKHAKHNGVLTSHLKNYQRYCRPQSYESPNIPIGITIDSQVFPWLSGKGWWPSKLRISRYSHKYSYRFPSILWLSGKGWWPSRLRISRYSYRYSYKIPRYSYGCQVRVGCPPSYGSPGIPIGIPIQFPDTPMAVR